MLDKLVKALEAAEEVMNAKRAAVTEIAAKEDAKSEDVKSADEAFKAARAEVDRLSADVEKAVEDAEAAKRRAGVLESGRKAAGVVKAGRALVEAEAKDHEVEAREEEAIFVRYASKGRAGLSPVEMERLSPKSTSFKSEDAQLGLRMPKSMVNKILGGLCRKAVPMTSGVAADGGFTFGVDFRAQLLQLQAEAPAMLPRATVVPTRTGTIQIPRLAQTDTNEYGGVSVAWTNEGGTKHETQAEFEQVEIATAELSAYTEATHRLLNRSAIDLESLLANLFRGAIYDAVDSALFLGTGIGQPLGIINTNGIRLVTRATAGAVVYDDLVKLKYALKPYHRASAIFIVNDDVALNLELAVDVLGRPLFTSSTANGINDRLVGKPWITCTRLPAIGNEGDVICIDPREYYVAMEEDVVVKRSDDYKFRNNAAAFAVFICVGGQLVQPRVCSVLNDTVS